MKILITIEQFNPEAKKILEDLGAVTYHFPAQNEFKDIIREYELVIAGLGLYFDKEIIDSAPNLKLIATATPGLDHIDVPSAQEKGIKVLSLQADDLREVTGTAELAFGLILALARRIPEAFDDVKNGSWAREKFLGYNLSGKVLGIVGLGRLGSMMARYGQAFGMRVITYDPYKESSDTARLVDFKTLLSESDIISIHAPLTDETINMFDEKAFSQMKKTVYLINTARGQIVNEADLLSALKNQTIAGYAADVLTGEIEFKKDASNHPLVQYAKTHNNIIITPHLGGYTAESRVATNIIIAQKIYDLVKKGF